MCLIALAWNLRPDLPLALIANRDEFHARAAAPAGPDPEAPGVLGGRDLERGGSWLQMSGHRRMAAVTNVRAGTSAETAMGSRGWLVRDFVRGTMSASAFTSALRTDGDAYGRFNLLVWDGDALWFASNHPGGVAHPVSPGLHAMSNGAFDAPWPKSTAATQALSAWLDRPAPIDATATHAVERDDLAPLFSALRDTRIAPDALLPDTGVGLTLERCLSPPFIDDPVYGTRCSTVVLATAQDALLVERRFGPDGAVSGESTMRTPSR